VWEEKLFEAIENENVEKVKSILENSTENKKILKLNEINNNWEYPLLWASSIITKTCLMYFEIINELITIIK